VSGLELLPVDDEKAEVDEDMDFFDEFELDEDNIFLQIRKKNIIKKKLYTFGNLTSLGIDCAVNGLEHTERTNRPQFNSCDWAVQPFNKTLLARFVIQSLNFALTLDALSRDTRDE
jgi:hypothetical protein